MEFACMVRTKYLLLPGDDEFERKKWSLQELSTELADQTSLFGLARAQVVTKLREDLKHRNERHDMQAIEQWFSTVNFANSSEKITAKTAGVYTKIITRFFYDPAVAEVVQHLDNHFGRNHSLATISVLDQICQKTSLPQAIVLEGKLLRWVVDGIAVHTLRHNLKKPVPREEIMKSLVPVLLLQRRVAIYFTTKYKFRNEADIVYINNRSPEHVMANLFSSMRTYHAAFPKGTPLAYEFTGMDATLQPAATLTNIAWMGQLSETQNELITFIREFFDFRPDIIAVANRTLASCYNVTAEAFLNVRDFKESLIFNMDRFTEEYEKQQYVDQASTLPPVAIPLPVQAPDSQASTVGVPLEEDPYHIITPTLHTCTAIRDRTHLRCIHTSSVACCVHSANAHVWHVGGVALVRAFGILFRPRGTDGIGSCSPGSHIYQHLSPLP
jgi:hypothetical protein